MDGGHPALQVSSNQQPGCAVLAPMKNVCARRMETCACHRSAPKRRFQTPRRMFSKNLAGQPASPPFDDSVVLPVTSRMCPPDGNLCLSNEEMCLSNQEMCLSSEELCFSQEKVCLSDRKKDVPQLGGGTAAIRSNSCKQGASLLQPDMIDQ